MLPIRNYPVQRSRVLILDVLKSFTEGGIKAYGL
jgi:hypothetical protein